MIQQIRSIYVFFVVTLCAFLFASSVSSLWTLEKSSVQIINGLILSISILFFIVFFNKKAFFIRPLVVNMLFVMWNICVGLLFPHENLLIKFGSLTLNFLILPAAVWLLLSSRKDVMLFAQGVLTGLLVFFFLSNIIQPIQIDNLYNPMLARYVGLAGPNEHGMLSTIAILLCFLGGLNTKALILALPYFILNLYITGSRAAILSLLLFVLYVFLKTLPKKVVFFFVMFIISFVTMGVYYMYLYDPKLVRLDEYSLMGRWLPIQEATSIVIENYGMPQGHGFVNKFLEVLDNVYLVVALETGIIGLLILIYMVYSHIKWAASIPPAYECLRLAYDDTYLKHILGGMLVALLFHGFFSTMMFVGLYVTTLCYWYAIISLKIYNQQFLWKN